MRKFENYQKIYRYIAPLDCKHPDYRKCHQIQNLFLYFENYLNLTTNQWRRIANNMAELNLLPCSGKLVQEDLLVLLGDIHFMFISLEKAYKIAFRLLLLLDNKPLYEESRSSFLYTNIKQIRNCLEHMDENLTDKDTKNNYLIQSYSPYTNWFCQQWGTIVNDKIILGKYSYELSEASLSPVQNLYDSILKLIEEKYVLPNREVYDMIFKK
ncbi:MAG: hypothetical protein Q4F03_09530 [Eubacteriales bacterium]|nr:hypothetical protein [Eubacteriales bacterium]